jgi:hypothetical protein
MVDPGRVAHEAYCKAANVKPVWEGLNQDIQNIWRQVAIEVMRIKDPEINS